MIAPSKELLARVRRVLSSPYEALSKADRVFQTELRKAQGLPSLAPPGIKLDSNARYLDSFDASQLLKDAQQKPMTPINRCRIASELTSNDEVMSRCIKSERLSIPYVTRESQHRVSTPVPSKAESQIDNSHLVESYLSKGGEILTCLNIAPHFQRALNLESLLKAIEESESESPITISESIPTKTKPIRSKVRQKSTVSYTPKTILESLRFYISPKPYHLTIKPLRLA